jgi:hypothetical protein
VKEKLRVKLSPRTFTRLDKTLFPFVASLLWLNPILVIQGIQHWAPSNLSYKTSGLILSFIFMYWMSRHRLAWWEKYNYVLSAALTAGVAVSALVIFFATGYNPKSLKWWVILSVVLEFMGVGRVCCLFLPGDTLVLRRGVFRKA